jgi:hypothetical protein
VSTFFQHSFEIPSKSSNTGRIQIGTEEAKLSLLEDDIILYLKDPKSSTTKFLYNINSLSNVAGYKINLQK